MAISIINTTTAALTNSSYTVNIPATTQGSTLIVSVTSVAGTGQFPFWVVDNIQGFPAYTKVVDAARTDSGVHRTLQTHYRDNVEAGVTQVYVVPNNVSGMNMYAVVYEATGINHTTPFEAGNFRNFVDSGSSSSGTALVTAFTNALFIGNCVRTSAASLSMGGGFSSAYSVSAGITSHIHGTKIASGSNTVVINHASGSAGCIIGVASFNPSPNSYILNLSDSVGVTDDIVEETNYIRTFNDSVNLLDDIELINFSNNQFKNLNDTMTVIDTLDTVLSANREFSDSVFLGDNISFQSNSERTFMDEVRLTEWMSIKKVNSTGWGD